MYSKYFSHKQKNKGEKWLAVEVSPNISMDYEFDCRGEKEIVDYELIYQTIRLD